MSRQMMIPAGKVMAIFAAIVGGFVMHRMYTQPDLQDRSTRELRWEVMGLGCDHAGKTLLFSGFALQRQEWITHELCRRSSEDDRNVEFVEMQDLAIETLAPMVMPIAASR